MKKYFYIFILIGFSCFGQVNLNNSQSNNNEEAIPFGWVEQIPLFVQCKNIEKTLQKECLISFLELHVKKTMKYPEEAKKAKVQSKVFTTFTIDKEGKIINLVVSGQPTSFKKAFENEAKRIINTFPKFIPGKHKNELVNVQVMLPIEFTLEEKKAEKHYSEMLNTVTETAETEEYIDEAIPFAVVEQIPLFENCKSVEKKDQMNCFYEEISKHIKKELKYPKEAKKDKIEDRVITVFEIDKQGKITNIHARGKKSNYKTLFEEEAKRIIQTLPPFSPGLQRGKAVIVKYSMPITFKL